MQRNNNNNNPPSISTPHTNDGSSIVVLVTGTRHEPSIGDAAKVRDALQDMNRRIQLKFGSDKKVVLVHGDCRGIDKFCEKCVLAELKLGWRIVRYAVSRGEWKARGALAGPMRNERMLLEMKPHYVLAFPAPDSRGTRSCVARAKEMRENDSESRICCDPIIVELKDTGPDAETKGRVHGQDGIKKQTKISDIVSNMIQRKRYGIDGSKMKNETA